MWRLVLVRAPGDFAAARKSCRDMMGDVPRVSKEQAQETLAAPLSGRSGSYWVDREDTEGDLGLCSSVSVSGGGEIALSWGQCAVELDGFVCQFEVGSTCARLGVDGAAQVNYTAYLGFDLSHAETLPLGTVAVVQKLGGSSLDSKHLCAHGGWMRAPWSCEVMQGGCAHGCNSTHTCTCPPGQTLHPNGVTCNEDPCAECAEGCKWNGVSHACVCKRKGYRLAQDGKGCVDVDECAEEDLCMDEGEECVNTHGGFECQCRDGFLEEDGACVDVTICPKCEHMKCVKLQGVYGCACREGFRVSDRDPTKCERHCTQRDCVAVCHRNDDKRKPDMLQCDCPRGYIKDLRGNDTICTDMDECEMKPCDHECENLFGDYRCSCREGFRLQGRDRCVAIQEDKEDKEEDESGSGGQSTPAPAHPAAVPSYIKTGSVLGIAVFMALGAALLCVVARATAKRCSKFELASLRHRDIDVFHLQQVTTENYKRLSFDKQSKSDVQRQ